MDSSFSSERGRLPSEPLGARNFPTTLWTVVLNAIQDDSVLAHAALARLCEAYWYPLYAFVHRRGHAPHDAQDLTQAFFAQLLEKHGLHTVAPAKGRFRTFLLAALKNFLANEWDKSQTLKRGGGKSLLSLEQVTAESRYQFEPNHELTPERLFERQWALSLLEQTLETLRCEYQAGGNGPLFEELKGTLTGVSGGYAEIAAHLGRTEAAIKVAAHRLRHRYRELIRSQIAETVTDGDLEDELRHLMAVLRD